MPPDQIIAVIDLALTVIEKLGPQLGAAFSSGQVSVEKQQELKNRIALIESGEAFNKPNWQPDAE